MGTSLYVLCGSDGRRAPVLVGPEGPSARLRLVIDTQTVAMDFVEQGAEYLALLPPGSTVLAALWQAQVPGGCKAAGARRPGLRMNSARAAIAAACP